MTSAKDAELTTLDVGDQVAVITAPNTIQRATVIAIEPGKPGLVTLRLARGEHRCFGFMTLIIQKGQGDLK